MIHKTLVITLCLLLLVVITPIPSTQASEDDVCWEVEYIRGMWNFDTTAVGPEFAYYPIGSSESFVTLDDYTRVGYPLLHEGFITNITLIAGDWNAVMGMALNSTPIAVTSLPSNQAGQVQPTDTTVHPVTGNEFLSAYRAEEGGSPSGVRWIVEYHYHHPYQNSCGSTNNTNGESTMTIYVEPLVSLIAVLLFFAFIILAEWKRDPLYYILSGLLGLLVTLNLPDVFPAYTRVFFIALSLYLVLRAYLSYSDARMQTELMDET